MSFIIKIGSLIRFVRKISKNLMKAEKKESGISSVEKKLISNPSFPSNWRRNECVATAYCQLWP